MEKIEKIEEIEEIIDIELTIRGKLRITVYSDEKEFIDEMKNLGVDLKSKNNLDLKEEHINLIREYFNDYIFESVYDMLDDMLDEKNTTFKLLKCDDIS